MRPTPFLALVLFAAAPAFAAETEKVTGANYPLAAKFNSAFIYQHVQEATVVPTFIGKTDQFWYGVRTPNGTKYWRIDPTRKLREALFDAAKLAAQLSEAVQKPIDTDTLALSRVTVTDDGAKLRFVHTDFQFEYEFGPAKLTKLGKAAPAPRTFPKGGMDERTRETRAGLGFARAIVRAHGGSMAWRRPSDPAKGTLLRVRWPR